MFPPDVRDGDDLLLGGGELKENFLASSWTLPGVGGHPAVLLVGLFGSISIKTLSLVLLLREERGAMV
jgi:hypothetical protein